MVNPVTIAARGLLASVFISGGINQVRTPDFLGTVVDKAKQTYGVDVPVPGKQLVVANGAGMAAAGGAMALGILPRTSALALAGLLVPTNIVGHPYWTKEKPGDRARELSGFLSNTAIIGGLLMVALDRGKK